MRLIYISLFIIWFLVGCAATNNSSREMNGGLSALNTDRRPNILLIVADDLGFGDIGAFGSEISTPNIDSLATEGARFTSFYTQATCSPTRSILLTGVDNHLNGLGTMHEDHLPHHDKLPGYSGYLNHQVVTVATLLKENGYQTHMAGKWHLGLTPELDPYNRGFEHSYVLLHGGGNHFNDKGNNTLLPRVSYTENGQPISRPEGVYSSQLFTDRLLEGIKNHDKTRSPFFAYLSFTAPHFPLQAPKQIIEKYRNRYDAGWDVIRAKRFQNLQQIDIVPDTLELPPRIKEIPAWESLTAEERRIEARKMEIYAAMVDQIDHHVGRVVNYLKQIGKYENTLILFMSDNGADPYDRSNREIYQQFLAQGYNNSLQNMGAADSYIFAGLGWAQVGSVHHRYYKFLPTEGGIHAPLIARYGKLIKPGDDRDAFVSVLDITPTILDLAGVTHPEKIYQNREIHPMRGRSILPYLEDVKNQPYANDEAIAFEIFGHASVFMGPWKAVRLREPWTETDWRLYHLKTDPGEQQNLAREEPEILNQMKTAYHEFKSKNGVINEPDGTTAYPFRPGHLGDLILPKNPSKED